MAPACFITPGRSLERAIERVQLAESLGYESVWTTHIAGAESLTVLTAYALRTERIRLGTGVVPIYTRTPATMAQTAATVDVLSGGRLLLGLGVSHRMVVEGWYGQTIDRPVAEMREYVAIVRAILRGEDPPAGRKWQTGFHLFGVDARADLPVYIAGLSPAMLRLAGEIADGVVLWLCTPDYIRDVVVPEVRAGAERAGRSPDACTIVAGVPAAVTDDVAAAYNAVRGELLVYFGLPFYRAVIARSGFEREIAEFDSAGGDHERMRAAISDEFLATLCAVGDADAVRAGLARYVQAGTDDPLVGPISMADVDATLRAGAPER